MRSSWGQFGPVGYGWRRLLRNIVMVTTITGIRVSRDTESEQRPGSAGNCVENEKTNKGSHEARQKTEGFARNPRNQISTDLSLGVPKGTPRPGIKQARASGPERGGSLAVPLKEHGKASTRSREGSQEVREGAECGGCRAPPQPSITNRNPPTHLGEVGVHSR